MRKIIVSMNVTLDGYMAGPNGELDWHFESWTPDLAESLCEQLRKADTIILGRVTYNAMANFWENKAIDLSFPREDIAFAEMMNSYTKVVFSKTLTRAAWNNSKLVNANTRMEILKLKQSCNGRDKDIIIYGSGKLVSSLMQLCLIDEYTLWVHPVILGTGIPLFKNVGGTQNLKFIKGETFKNGVVCLYYQPARKKEKNHVSPAGKEFLHQHH